MFKKRFQKLIVKNERWFWSQNEIKNEKKNIKQKSMSQQMNGNQNEIKFNNAPTNQSY